MWWRAGYNVSRRCINNPRLKGRCSNIHLGINRAKIRSDCDNLQADLYLLFNTVLSFGNFTGIKRFHRPFLISLRIEVTIQKVTQILTG